MTLIRRTLTLAAVAAACAIAPIAPPAFAKGAAPKTPPAPKPPPTPPTKPPPEVKAKDIIETLTASTDPTFKTLVDALKAADLTATLKGAGPFTLFAPSDDAFKSLPAGTLAGWMKPENKATLRGILNDHIVNYRLLVVELAKLKTLKCAGAHRFDVKIGDDGAWVGIQDSKVTRSGVVAGNGIIHFMDAVIVVKEAGGAATAAPGPAPARVYTEAELATFKSLAAATLQALELPGNAGMVAKLTDLETAWDDQEKVLKPKDPATWDVLDKTLDKAISALRSSKTDFPKGKAALQELIKEYDQATKPK